jgi:hypothetical protein
MIVRMRSGRLQKAERVRIVEMLAHLLIEVGETRFSELSRAVGVSRRRIGPLVAEARKLIAVETNETPAAARTKLVGRFDKLYREALASYEECKRGDRHREAAQYLATATAVVAGEAKARAIDQVPAQSGDRPSARLVFESYDAIPAAAAARLASLFPDSSSATAPRLSGAVQGVGGREPAGQRHLCADGAAAGDDVALDGATDR